MRKRGAVVRGIGDGGHRGRPAGPRHIGMHDPDLATVGQFHGQCMRQIAQRCQQGPRGCGIRAVEPVAAVAIPQPKRCRLDRLAAHGIQHHLFVVAAHGEEPRLFEEIDRAGAGRAAIDQIAHRQQPVAVDIETENRQGPLQGIEMPVDITHDVITATRVGRQPSDTFNTLHV